MDRIPLALFLLFFAFGSILLASAPTPRAQPVAARPAGAFPISTQPAYGVNFISWAKGLSAVSEERYQNGLATGASWNRWPMYWNNIEQTAGMFSWAYQDAAVQADISHGLRLNVILLGTPPFYTSANAVQLEPVHRPLALDGVQAATPQGLYEGVFADGSDNPGPGKSINPNNRWARFVATAVNRYKPGGLIAQQEAWPAGVGVTHWEMWNEPDLPIFWDSSTADYARLLKVGYLATKHSDPQAQVLFGGVANNNENLQFYNDVLAIFDADDQAAANGYYHDIFATHNYLYSWDSWYHVWRAQNSLDVRGLEKPIWLNESGVPVWDDYPGPVCEPGSPFRATMSEQADFIFQSAFYATYAGADTLFFFQLYDDCGNQPGNTNFSPVDICMQNAPGGDAFGLFRNVADPALSGCYWEHPLGGTPRPGFTAFQTLANYFTDVTPLWRQRVGGTDPFNGPQEWIAFYQPGTQSRVLGVWNRFGMAETAVIPTTNSNGTALLVSANGLIQTIEATEGYFALTLPGATNQNAIWDPNLYPIGGGTFMIIEKDDLPPIVTLTADIMATTEINLSWSGEDGGSGIAAYDIQFSIDGGEWENWLSQVTGLTAVFPSAEGHIYRFRLRGIDQAGNRSVFAEKTAYTIPLPEKIYFPDVTK